MSGQGGAREGAGRKPSGDPCRKLSIAPRQSEYAVLKEAAAAEGKTFSRYVIDAAMEKASALQGQKRRDIKTIYG